MCIYVQYMRTYINDRSSILVRIELLFFYFLVLAGLPEKIVNSKIVNMISTVE